MPAKASCDCPVIPISRSDPLCYATAGLLDGQAYGRAVATLPLWPRSGPCAQRAYRKVFPADGRAMRERGTAQLLVVCLGYQAIKTLSLVEPRQARQSAIRSQIERGKTLRQARNHCHPGHSTLIAPISDEIFRPIGRNPRITFMPPRGTARHVPRQRARVPAPAG